MLFVSGNSVLTGAGWAGGDKGIHGSNPQTRGLQKGRCGDGILNCIQLKIVKASERRRRSWLESG
jgi:hypothetical protein